MPETPSVSSPGGDRRRASVGVNGSGGNNGLESSTAVLAFVNVLRRHGPSVIISLWFTYWLTSQVSATIAAVQRDLVDHMRVSAFYSRQICINTAQTESQRASCEPLLTYPLPVQHASR